MFIKHTLSELPSLQSLSSVRKLVRTPAPLQFKVASEAGKSSEAGRELKAVRTWSTFLALSVLSSMRNREETGIKKVAVLARRCASLWGVLCWVVLVFFLMYRKGAEKLFPYVIYFCMVFLLLMTTVPWPSPFSGPMDNKIAFNSCTKGSGFRPTILTVPLTAVVGALHCTATEEKGHLCSTAQGPKKSGSCLSVSSM